MAEKGDKDQLTSQHSTTGKLSNNWINIKTAPKNYQLIELIKKQHLMAEKEDKDQLIPTFPNRQTINQLNKKQTAPDGGEGG